MKKQVLLMLLVCIGFHTLEAQTKSEKKQLKLEKDKQAYEFTKRMIASGDFTFFGEWLFPLGGGRINLIGNPNHLKFEGGEVDGYLPFFGVIHRIGAYNGRGGIEFKGEAEDYEVTHNEDKQRINIEFDVENKIEQFNVSLTVYAKGTASMVVNSNNRNSISYRGKIKPLEK